MTNHTEMVRRLRALRDQTAYDEPLFSKIEVYYVGEVSWIVAILRTSSWDNLEEVLASVHSTQYQVAMNLMDKYTLAYTHAQDLQVRFP